MSVCVHILKLNLQSFTAAKEGSPLRMQVWGPPPPRSFPCCRLASHTLLPGRSSRKRERGERSHKGLRQFSLRVCKKVQEHGRTSYKRVADALVAELEEVQRTDSDLHTSVGHLDLVVRKCPRRSVPCVCAYAPVCFYYRIA